MFSELVDRAVHTAGRPDCLMDIAYAANETMRDLSKRSDWDDDMVEEQIPVDPYLPNVQWEPSVGRSRFRREDFIVDGSGCSPERVRPSHRMMRKQSAFYYKSGNTFVFSKVSGPLLISYWAYQPWLQYYPTGTRPATFDVETNDWDGAAEADIDLVSNWLLERHNNIVLTGTLANFFKTKADQRQSVHYSAYEQGIKHMVSAESARELLARG